MATPPEYNKHIRNALVAFTTLFNDISINRIDENGVVEQTIKVPVTISSKSKWWRKLRDQVREAPKGISRVLPKMGIDITGIRYDSSRAGVPTTKHVAEFPLLDSSSSSSSDSFHYKKRYQSYMRVPYTYDFELSIATNSMTDSLMILEQITPYFRPELSITINDQNTLDIDTDMTVILRDSTKESTRLDDFEEADLITWTLGFEMRGYMYSPVSSQGVILTSLVNLYDKLDEDNPNKIANIKAETLPETELDVNDPDTYETTITEYIDGFYHSSSSSSSS